MKKILAVCLLLVVVLFSGCAQINYAVCAMADGSVCEVYQVKLNKQVLDEKYIDASIVLEEVKSQMENWLKNSLQNRSVEGFSHVIEKDAKNYCVSLNLKYVNYDCYKSFWKIEDLNGTKEKQTEFHFLYDTLIVSKSKTIFKDAKNSSFATHFKNIIEEKFGETSFNGQDFVLGFVYAMPNTNILSNANQVVVKNQMAYHIWQFNLSNCDEEIVFYVPIIQAHNVACAFLCVLFATFVFMIVLFFRLKEKVKS